MWVEQPVSESSQSQLPCNCTWQAAPSGQGGYLRLHEQGTAPLDRSIFLGLHAAKGRDQRKQIPDPSFAIGVAASTTCFVCCMPMWR